MSFLLRIVIAILILFIIEFVFVKKLNNAFNHVLRTRYPFLSKWVKYFYLIFINIFPVLLLTYWSYSYLAESTETIRIDNPLWDYLVVYPFWVLAIVTIQSFLLFVVIDLTRLILHSTVKRFREKIRTVSLKANFVIIIFFLLYVPLRVVIDYNMVSVRIKEFKRAGLPESLEGFKIAVIGDIHADKYNDSARLSNYINEVNQANPDLVLITGDLISSTPDYIKTSAEHLSKLKATYGIFSCIGDHDNWAYRGDIERSRKEIKSAMEKVNIPFVHNSNKNIQIKDARIGLTFITHTYSEFINEELLDSLTSNCVDCDFKIFLTHQPRQFLMDKALEHNYDLYLAGHTHGGQLSFLFPFITLSPTIFETRYVRGDFFIDDMMITITRGLGMSIAPLRYNSTPEITVIVLGKKE